MMNAFFSTFQDSLIHSLIMTDCAALFLLSVFASAELEVARMSTDGNLPDLRFPQTGGQGNSIHLSANTLKQHGRNG